MEARRLEPKEPYDAREPSFYEPDEPVKWRSLIALIHPYVWVAISALWIGLACLVFYEAG